MPGEIGERFAVGNADTAYLEDWVNVEMSDDELGFNRVSGKELEHVEERAGKPRKDHLGENAALERMFTVVLRESDGEIARESLDKVIKRGTKWNVDAEDGRQLEKACLRASNTLHDLDAWTGKDLLAVKTAADKNWKDLDPACDMQRISQTRAALQDAIMSQLNYADKLEECAEKEEQGNLERAQALRDLAATVRKRAAAIESLPDKLAAAAADSAAGPDPYGRMILGRRGFADVVYSQEAEKMLGGNVVEKLQNKGPGVLRTAYYERFGAYQSVKKSGVSQKDMALVAARNLRDGFRKPEDALKTLRDIGAKLEGLQATAYRNALPLNLRYENFTHLADNVNRSFADFKAAMNRYVSVHEGKKVKQEDVDSAWNDLKEAAARLDGSILDVRIVLRKFKSHCAELQKSNAQISDEHRELERLFEAVNVSSVHAFESSEELTKVLEPAAKGKTTAVTLDLNSRYALMEGTRRISTEVEAQVWGAGGLHDKSLDGFVLVDVKDLGHGAFNSVKLCTFKKNDGTTDVRVFRPDGGAIRSIRNGSIADYLSDRGKTSGFGYNLAAGTVASQIGCDDVFPKTTFATLDGQPGMFLEFAPGKTGDFLAEHVHDDSADDPFRDTPPNESIEVAGEAARKLNRLQWLDFLTGQIDRHMGNLMIGKSGNEVSVKGIDNDECFPDRSIGDGLLVFNSPYEAKFVLDELGLPVEVKLEDLMSMSQTRIPDSLADFTKGKFVLDIRNLHIMDQVAIIKRHNSFGMPGQIDEELKNNLMAIDLEEYGQGLRDVGLTEDQIFAAKARLIHARAVIGSAAPPTVYAAEDWKDRQNLKALADGQPFLEFKDKIKTYNDGVPMNERSRDLISLADENDCINHMSNYYRRSNLHRYLRIGGGNG